MQRAEHKEATQIKRQDCVYSTGNMLCCNSDCKYYKKRCMYFTCDKYEALDLSRKIYNNKKAEE